MDIVRDEKQFRKVTDVLLKIAELRERAGLSCFVVIVDPTLSQMGPPQECQELEGLGTHVDVHHKHPSHGLGVSQVTAGKPLVILLLFSPVLGSNS